MIDNIIEIKEKIGYQEIILKSIISKKKIKELEGHYFDQKDFPLIINHNVDVYYLVPTNPKKSFGKKKKLEYQKKKTQKKNQLNKNINHNSNSNHQNYQKKLLLKFRKNVIPKKLCQQAYQALIDQALVMNFNRGAAAGLIDSKKLPNYVGKIVQKFKYRAYYHKRGKSEEGTQKDQISNPAMSGIIGYYDRADRNLYRRKSVQNNLKKGIKPLPCRVTKFTKENPEKWEKTLPLIRKIDSLFKKLVPRLHQKQLERASKTPDFQIGKTAFSTATINYNWQTALHLDKGDFQEGFGNLIVLEKGNYQGGYTGFPEYGVAVNVRQGDFLAMDVHQYHANTPLEIKEKDVRLSLVCYLREKMIQCQKN